MAFNKLTDNGSTTPASLVAAFLAHTFALFVTVSGRHVNPIVTFGAFVDEVIVWNMFVFGVVMTFRLVYTVYTIAIDPKKGNLGIIAPTATDFIVGVNILIGGAFDGASMNPTVSFGTTLMNCTCT